MTGSENDRLHDEHVRLLALWEASASGSVDLEPDPTSDAAGRPFGPYRLGTILGHGGQGVVHGAVDQRLGRPVALKLLSARASALPDSRARFEREVFAVSRLRHPGLCTVYEAGEIDGQRYLAMELIDGQSLSQWIERVRHDVAGPQASSSGGRRAWVQRALEIVEQVARAVAAAHAAGVVHRDLKPGNVMLRGDGSAVVLDFGLAWNDDDRDVALTAPGDVLGTPAYMPPERVRGVHGPADPREDVYGLGAILHEVLTGAPPFGGTTREELYRRILTEEPADPRRANPAVPAEARFVVQTALEKERDRRYATASEFADDVARLRRREPIHARPVPVWRRAWRWVQRNPRVAVPTFAAFAMLVVGVAVAFGLLARVGDEARRTRVRALLGASGQQLGEDPQLALLLVRDAAAALREGDERNLEVEVRSHLLTVLRRCRRLGTFEHGLVSNRIAFLGDGARLVSVVRGDQGPEVLRWFDATSFAELGSYSVPELPGTPSDRLVTAADVDPLGARVLLGTFSGTCLVVSVDASDPGGRLLHELVPAEPTKLEYAHSETRAATGRLVSFVPGRLELVVTGQRDGMTAWRLEPDVLRATPLWKDRQPRSGGELGVCQIEVSDDGAWCAAGDHDGRLRVVRTDDGALLGEAIGLGGAVHALAFDPGGRFLVSGAAAEGRLRVWEVDESLAGTESPALRQVGVPALDASSAVAWETNRAQWLDFAPAVADDAQVLAVGDQNRDLWFFEQAAEGETYALRNKHTASDSAAMAMAWSPDGRRLAVGWNGSRIQVFDRAGRVVEDFKSSGVSVDALGWAPDGTRFATKQKRLGAVWRVDDDRFGTWRLPLGVMRIAVAGERLVAVLRDGSLAVIDRSIGGIARARGRTRGLVSLEPSADGRRVALASAYGLIDVWDISTGDPVLLHQLPRIHAGFAGLSNDQLAFDGAGNLVVGAAPHARVVQPDGSIEELFDTPEADGLAAVGGRVALIHPERPTWDYTEPAGEVPLELCFPLRADRSNYVCDGARGGRWLAVLDQHRGEISIVDAERHAVRHVLPATAVLAVALSSDGRRLLSGGRSGDVLLWDLTGAQPEVELELRGHRGIVWGVDFSDDDSEAVVGCSDGTVRTWPLDLERLDTWIEERLVRDWSDNERTRFAALLGR